MSIVVKARLTEKGIIVHELANGELKEYRAIRGGISWPLMEENLPGYCCIFGEEWVRWTEHGKLILLSECEAPDIRTSLTTFFTKLTDESRLYRCETFYTVTKEFHGEDHSGYAEAFQKFTYEKEITAHLEEAPWADNPDLGIYHIQAWMGKGLLELPEGSLVREQLRRVENSKVNQVPQMFNAVNALRFVICSFEKYKPTNTNSNWRSKMRKGTWRSV